MRHLLYCGREMFLDYELNREVVDQFKFLEQFGFMTHLSTAYVTLRHPKKKGERGAPNGIAVCLFQKGSFVNFRFANKIDVPGFTCEQMAKPDGQFRFTMKGVGAEQLRKVMLAICLSIKSQV